MTIPEVEESLRTMVIIIDNREQQTDKSLRRYKSFGCPYERGTLKTGDYSAKFMLPDGSWFDMSDYVTVERKMDLDETASCFGQQRTRFIKEHERAKENLVRMWILLENSSFEKIYNHKYRSQMHPKSLIAGLLAFQSRYNLRIVMCTEFVSGMLIHDILYYEGREMLMGMVDE